MPNLRDPAGRNAPNGEPAVVLDRLRAEDHRRALEMSVDDVLERIRSLAEFASWIGMPARR
ncbi:MAG: hypothetical protein AABM29_05635 [Actinomycetota bacterium]